MSGSLVSPELLTQIYAVIRGKMQEHLSFDEANNQKPSRFASRFPTHKVILDATVPAIASPLAEVEGSTDPSKPNATICTWSASRRRWVQSAKRLAVANDTDEEYPVDNIAWAIPQAGIYLLGGCPVEVSNRPDPPWLIAAQSQASIVTPTQSSSTVTP